MSRVASALALLLLTAACADEQAAPRGIQTRVFMDRTFASVGDPVGVTIEIETPAGFAIEPPGAPAPNAGFSTERVELLEPIESAGAVRHHVLWTLRARDVGEHLLPEIRVPLVHPDGRIQPLVAGGLPLVVRSVRTELPEREAFFDIRDAPELPRSSAPLLIGGGVFAVGALLLALVVRHRRDEQSQGPDPVLMARRALEQLELALGAQDSPPREVAVWAQQAVWGFVGPCFDVPVETSTPDDLPERVDGDLREALAALERQRFSPGPARSDVIAAGESARVLLRGLAGDAELA